MKEKKPVTNQGGFSLTELMIVMLVIGIILVGIFAIYYTLTSTVKNKSMNEQITMIHQGVNQLYQPSGGNYTGLTTSTVIGAGLVLSDMLQNNGTVIGTSWYGQDHTSVITVAPFNTTEFKVTVTNIPKENCTAIGSNYLNGNALAVNANGTDVTDSGALATACSTSDIATLIFTFA